MRDHVVFDGKPAEYVDSIKRVLRRHQHNFINLHRGLGHLKFYAISKTDYEISLGGYGLINPGQTLTLLDYPLQFKDGSILTLAQRFTYDQGYCWVKESVIRFLKIDEQKMVRYLFHYDTIIDVPNHPDHHLQFDFDPRVRTPRFRLLAYEDLDTILQMIVRDRIA